MREVVAGVLLLIMVTIAWYFGLWSPPTPVELGWCRVVEATRHENTWRVVVETETGVQHIAGTMYEAPKPGSLVWVKYVESCRVRRYVVTKEKS